MGCACCKKAKVVEEDVDNRVGYRYTDSDGESDKELEGKDNSVVNEHDIGVVEMYVVSLDIRGIGGSNAEEPAPIQAQLYAKIGEKNTKGAKNMTWHLHARKEAQPAPCGRLYTNYNSSNRHLMKEKVRYRAPRFTFPTNSRSETPMQIRLVSLEKGSVDVDDARSAASGLTGISETEAQRRTSTVPVGVASFTIGELLSAKGRTKRLELVVATKVGSMEGRTKRVGSLNVRLTPKGISRDPTSRSRTTGGNLGFGDLMGDGTHISGPGAGKVYDSSVVGGVRTVAAGDRGLGRFDSEESLSLTGGMSPGGYSTGAGTPGSEGGMGLRRADTRNNRGGGMRGSQSFSNVSSLASPGGMRGSMSSSRLAGGGGGDKYRVPQSPGQRGGSSFSGKAPPPHILRAQAQARNSGGEDGSAKKKFGGGSVAPARANQQGLTAARTVRKRHSSSQ